MERIPVKVGSYVIHVRKLTSDHKTSVILIHGLGVSGDYYVQYAKKLAHHYDVYIVDLPGYGKTPKPTRPLDITALSKVVVKYVSKSNIKNIVIVGQSMGCQIVARAITTAPGLFHKAILLAPTVNDAERTLPLQSFRLLQDTFHEPKSAKLIVLKNYVHMGLRRFLITSKYMIDDHIENVINKSEIPVLMVSGEKDKIVPAKWVQHLARITPHAESIEVPGAPHLLQYDKPAVLFKITREFIDR